jgi:AAA+ ATPase superfamily predicted ATPase
LSFFPQAPVPPRLFGDRKRELDDLREIIRQSAAAGKTENAVICGERGFGKTSLLLKILEECPPGCFSSFRALSSHESPAEFTDATIQKMDIEYRQQLPKHEKYLKLLVDHIEEFSLLDVGVKIRRQDLTPENGLLEALLKFRDRKFSSVIIFTDEADLLSKEILALLKNVVEEIRTRYSYGVAIFLAGKEDVTNRLTGEWSPIRRFYTGHIHKLELFDLEGTREALTKGGSAAGFTWSEEAVKSVFDESQGHPFIVQIFGDRAVKISTSKNITAEDVGNAKHYVLQEVWEWYRQSWTGVPSPTETKVLIQLARLGGRASFSDVKSKLRVASLGVHLRRLVEKKVLLQDEQSGEYYYPTKLLVEGMAKGLVQFT